jgi:hypothetical protein
MAAKTLPMFAVIHEDDGNKFGPRRCVAMCDIAPGTLITLEHPLAIAPPGIFDRIQADSPFHPLPEALALDEWLLTFLLLSQGKREAWSRNYVRDSIRDLEHELPIQWLSVRFSCQESDVVSIFRTVRVCVVSPCQGLELVTFLVACLS